HRFLTHGGWKYVSGADHGPDRRPHLTLDDEFIGFGALGPAGEANRDYRQGYLCFQAATASRRAMDAVRPAKASAVDQIRALIAWPVVPSDDWRRGFLAGIFDAEGSGSVGVL